MRTVVFAAAVLTVTSVAASPAQSIDPEAAVKHGFQPLPAPPAEAATPAARAAPPIYVKLVEPGRRVSMLDTGMKKEANAKYSIVTFEFDCALGALRYRSAQIVEPPWTLLGMETFLPRVPWHTPHKASVAGRTLRFACKA